MDAKELAVLPFDVFQKQFIWIGNAKLYSRDVFSKIPVEYIDSNDQQIMSEISALGYEDIDKMIRFVIVFTDPLSPLWKESDFEYRKRAAWEVLGHKESDSYLWFVLTDHSFFNLMLYEYFKMTNSLLYETWFSAKIGLHQMNMQLRNPLTRDTDRLSYMKSIKDQVAMVIELQRQLFKDEHIEQIVSEQATKSRLGGYAEKYALLV